MVRLSKSLWCAWQPKQCWFTNWNNIYIYIHIYMIWMGVYLLQCPAGAGSGLESHLILVYILVIVAYWFIIMSSAEWDLCHWVSSMTYSRHSCNSQKQVWFLPSLFHPVHQELRFLQVLWSSLYSFLYARLKNGTYYAVVMSVHLSVRPSVHPSIRPSVLVFRTFLQHAMRYQFETWYIHSVGGTTCRVWVASQLGHFDLVYSQK